MGFFDHKKRESDDDRDIRSFQKEATEKARKNFQRVQDIQAPSVIYQVPKAADTTAASWRGPFKITRPSTLQILLAGVPTAHPMYALPCQPTDVSVPTGAFIYGPGGALYLLQVGEWYLYIPSVAGDPATFNILIQDISSELPAAQLAGGAGAPAGPGGAVVAAFDSGNAQESALGEYVRAALTAIDSTQAAGSQNRPLEMRLSSIAAFPVAAYSLLVLNKQYAVDQAGGGLQPISSDLVPNGILRSGASIEGLYVNATTFGYDTQNAAVRPAEARAVAATKNTAFPRSGAQLIVGARQQVADQCLEATAAINVGVTLTIPAPGASLRQYLVRLKIEAYYGAALAAAAAPIIVTTGGTAGLTGTPTWNTPTGTAQGQKYDIVLEQALAIEAAADNGTITIICPANASIIWKVTAWWFNA